MVGASLSHRVANAGTLAIFGKIVGRIFDLVTLAVLSRLLAPADFGLTAIAMTAVSITEAVTQISLGQALQREEIPDDAMFNTAFTLALLRGLALGFLLGGASFYMSSIYHDPRLTGLISALALAPILRGVVNPRLVIYSKQLDVRRDTGIEVAGKIVAMLVAVPLAFITHSYWAIASATISGPLVMAVLSYILAPCRPRLTLIAWDKFRSFVGWGSVTQLVSTMNWQMDRLFLGYFLSAAIIGQYAQAAALPDVLAQALLVPMSGPLFVAYTHYTRNDSGLGAALYLKTSNAVLAIGGPAFLGLSLLAPPTVRLLLGDRWAEAGNLLQWLAALTLFLLPVYFVNSLALACGQARMMALRAIAEFAIAMPLLLAGSALYGVSGVIAARAVIAVLVLLIGMLAVRSLLACSLASQFRALRRSVLALAALALAEWPFRHTLDHAPPLTLALGLAALILTGAGVYVAALYTTWRLEGMPTGIETTLIEKARNLLPGKKPTAA
jgi:O-antigen/teichoic acid export membrane protein